MKRRANKRTAVLADWEKFVRRHKASRFLDMDPLYALTEPIIDAIKVHASNFFTNDDECFERDLARTASIGFFHGLALGLRPRRTQTPTALSDASYDHFEQSRFALQTIIGHQLVEDGLKEGEVREYFRRCADQDADIDARQRAYVGWLIGNCVFQNDVQALRGEWGSVIRQLGRFPPYPRWPYGDDLRGRRVPAKFRDDLYRFYARWGLDRLLTWDWPVPMAPDLIGGPLRDRHLPNEAGVVVFLPWYLFRGERLDLRNVVQRVRTTCGAQHLWPWLKKSTPKKVKELGDIRWERLHWMYRYYELVLLRRYPTAVAGSRQALDRALATVINRDEDSVKKLRLELMRARRLTTDSTGSPAAISDSALRDTDPAWLQAKINGRKPNRARGVRSKNRARSEKPAASALRKRSGRRRPPRRQATKK